MGLKLNYISKIDPCWVANASLQFTVSKVDPMKTQTSVIAPPFYFSSAANRVFGSIFNACCHGSKTSGMYRIFNGLKINWNLETLRRNIRHKTYLNSYWNSCPVCSKWLIYLQITQPHRPQMGERDSGPAQRINRLVRAHLYQGPQDAIAGP